MLCGLLVAWGDYKRDRQTVCLRFRQARRTTQHVRRGGRCDWDGSDAGLLLQAAHGQHGRVRTGQDCVSARLSTINIRTRYSRGIVRPALQISIEIRHM